MTLCHEPGAAEPDELLRQASRRLVQLITAEVNRAAARLGAQAKSVDVIETLVCLRRGVTTQRMRDEVARWSQRPYTTGEGWEVTMRFSGNRARTRTSRTTSATSTGAFVFWYLLAIVVVVLVEAVFVAEWERPRTETGPCLNRPSTYGLAVRWLAQRLLWTDPPGLSPATFQAWAVGWLTSFMSLVGLGVAIVAIIRYRRYRHAKAAELERFIGATDRQTRVLLMVATAAERDAVLSAVSAVNDTRLERRFLKDHTVFDLGRIGNAQILLAQCEQGAVGPGAAAIAAASLITRLEPDFLILTGICFGLRQDLQSLGDLVVCKQLRAIDHRKIDEATVLVRGDYVSPSQTLLSRFRSAEVGWTRAGVHFGPMLSSSVLVDSQQLRDELLRLEPEAYGGEMEGAGVYAAASPGKVDWIVVKAICDWGYGKTDEWQELAARNAAEFVVHTIRTGALDDR